MGRSMQAASGRKPGRPGARTKAARIVDSAMAHAPWLIGREVVEVEQPGSQRAGHGDELRARLDAGEKGAPASRQLDVDSMLSI